MTRLVLDCLDGFRRGLIIEVVRTAELYDNTGDRSSINAPRRPAADVLRQSDQEMGEFWSVGRDDELFAGVGAVRRVE